MVSRRPIRYTGTVNDHVVLRPVADAEFEDWARVIGESYGEDRSAAQLAHERAGVELDRTVAAFDGDEPVGGTAAYTRRLAVPGAVMPVAGVTWVGVAATHRRRGILTALMRRQLTDLHEAEREPIAALRPSEAAIYGRFGYGPATRGAAWRCDRRAMVLRPGTDTGAGRIRLLTREAAGPLIAAVYDEVWAGSPGWPERDARFWAARLYDEPQERGGATSLRFAVHREPDGRPTGYALYRRTSGVDVLGDERVAVGVAEVVELVATSRQAYAALWQYLAGIDLVARLTYEAAVDEPLSHLLVEPRAARATVVDRLWVRLVDVDRALAGRRYAAPLDLVLDVDDAFCPWNTGRYRLLADPDADAVACERTAAPADLRLTATELGAAFLGGTTLAELAAAGRVEELAPGALHRATTAFRGDREPFYPGGWAFPAY